MPRNRLAVHKARIERAVGRTRAAHAGEGYAVVRQALAEALEDEGAGRVVPQVVDHLAMQISTGRANDGGQQAP
ncbi:hypothetical protein [Streptomyces boluensis]|uniref:Uncharacterized protein n=1 Tax=Streptomyces boluensis TaxID=1775135 RepID=A0A964XQJ1_9ACTN|nr:hypothetical protein [Streptomyces boluensis]NBE56331.1 hypothetical protein [Streptomyces boluensis]